MNFGAEFSDLFYELIFFYHIKSGFKCFLAFGGQIGVSLRDARGADRSERPADRKANINQIINDIGSLESHRRSSLSTLQNEARGLPPGGALDNEFVARLWIWMFEM
jgi:hypothetical protein